jgi:ligand-binding SRPBCC domain-containing protein
VPKIILETIIEAPIERVFDLARSIDVHMDSTKATNERVIAGKKAGLIELGETVTWRAKHLGIHQNLCVQITKFERPYLFEDTMLSGAFKAMKHMHRFESMGTKTKMTDEFEFTSPLALIGKTMDTLYLKQYLRKFLLKRNAFLKSIAENETF